MFNSRIAPIVAIACIISASTRARADEGDGDGPSQQRIGRNPFRFVEDRLDAGNRCLENSIDSSRNDRRTADIEHAAAITIANSRPRAHYARRSTTGKPIAARVGSPQVILIAVGLESAIERGRGRDPAVEASATGWKTNPIKPVNDSHNRPDND